MAIKEMGVNEVMAVRPWAVPRGVTRHETDRAHRDVRQFLREGLAAAEVVGAIPEDVTLRDVNRVAHTYRKIAADMPEVVCVQRGRRVFLLRTEVAAACGLVKEGEDD